MMIERSIGKIAYLVLLQLSSLRDELEREVAIALVTVENELEESENLNFLHEVVHVVHDKCVLVDNLLVFVNHALKISDFSTVHGLQDVV